MYTLKVMIDVIILVHNNNVPFNVFEPIHSDLSQFWDLQINF